MIGYDPWASANAKEELPELEIAADPYASASRAHCIVIATDWEEFRHLDLAALREAMSYPVIVDGRNVLDPTEILAAGFSYYPTGGPRRCRSHPRPELGFSPRADAAVRGSGRRPGGF